MFGHLFIENLSTNPTLFFSVIITLVISVTLHELAHGFVAIKLGDDTPIESGHMTLNPLVHMGLQSAVLMFIFGIAFGAMPVNWHRLRGKYGEALVAVAGPAMNLLLGLLGLIALGLWFRFGTIDLDNHVVANGVSLLSAFGVVNLALMMFNLLPFPPLDGSWILANLVPSYRNLMGSDAVRSYGMIAFFVLFMFSGVIIFPIAQTMAEHVLVFIVGVGR